MSKKTLNNVRIVHKHDVESNWLKSSLVPMQGELIVYDIDETYNYERFKIGDGKLDVNSLPFTVVQPDWNQTDSAQADYIKNRTHYEENNLELITSIETSSFTLNSSNQYSCIINNYTDRVWVEGDKMTVIFNGNSYEFVGSLSGLIVGFGDFNEVGISISYMDMMHTLTIVLVEQPSVPVELYVGSKILVQLDEKFIPDTIARTTYIDDVVASLTDGSAPVAEATHATNADEATHATSADSATTATTATSATSATKATQDADGNVITETYQTKTDEALETISKEVVEAINELNAYAKIYEVNASNFKNLYNQLKAISDSIDDGNRCDFNAINTNDGKSFMVTDTNGKRCSLNPYVVWHVSKASTDSDVMLIKLVDAVHAFIIDLNPDGTYTCETYNYTKAEIDNLLATKSDTSHNHDDAYDTKGAAAEALASAQSYADSAATQVKNDLLNGAGEAYDTLKELGELIDTNVDAIEALETVASGKADKVHNHAISDVTNLQDKLDEISEKANESDVFVVTVTGDDENGYSADKTFAEITEAHENEKNIYAKYMDDLYLLDSYVVDDYICFVNIDADGYGVYTKKVVIWVEDEVELCKYNLSSVQLMEKVEYYVTTDNKTIVGAINELDAELDSHNHDDVYYTETEVDELLANKANTTHTHAISDITDLQTTLNNAASAIGANTDSINSHTDRITALETKVGDGFEEITSAEITALFA